MTKNASRGGVERNYLIEFGKFNNLFSRCKSEIKPKFIKTLPAFTLSEVLITLVIIGVIAAITVPVLWQNYQKQAIKSALKKNYSVLKQTIARYKSDTNETLNPEIMEPLSLKPILMQYLNVMYDCGIGANDKSMKCVPIDTLYDKSDVKYKTYNGKTYISTTYFDDGQFVLTDGTTVLIENNAFDHGGNIGKRAAISVDVNGFGKKPNKLGRDLFIFQLSKTGDLLPMGAKGTEYYSPTDEFCSDSSSSKMNGAGCTYLMLRE